ncbi:MAG: thrombospondin type 3 repeat-containing protein [Phycisphaerae bacterium]|nr:thrombospondin type 3 repeat-containing protein [Phycisphaerae bacterium]
MSIRPCLSAAHSVYLAQVRIWDALARIHAHHRPAFLDQMRRAGDEDRDGVPDARDNCPCAANPKQRDFDLDGLGDVCDQDDDNDAIPDRLDPAPYNPRIGLRAAASSNWWERSSSREWWA